MAGIPPFAGMFSKFFVFMAAAQQGSAAGAGPHDFWLARKPLASSDGNINAKQVQSIDSQNKMDITTAPRRRL